MYKRQVYVERTQLDGSIRQGLVGAVDLEAYEYTPVSYTHLLRGVLEFLSYMTLAVFAENVILARALGVTRLLKLVPDHKAQVWDYSLPFLLIMALSAPPVSYTHLDVYKRQMEPWLQGMNPSLYYTVNRLVQFWM